MDSFLLRYRSGLRFTATAEAAANNGMRTAEPALIRAAAVLFWHRGDKHPSREAGPHL
jgi:hypothetical protein